MNDYLLSISDEDSNAPFPDKMTIGEKYNPAMEVTTQAEADAYLARCIEHTMRVFGKSYDEAKQLELVNIGYVAGYYDAATRDRVYPLYQTAHPFFGTKTPTPEEALQAGKNLAVRS